MRDPEEQTNLTGQANKGSKVRQLAKSMRSVEVMGLTKRFGRETAVDNISFSVEEGEFFVIIGPSGCGKTTLLRCIAGLLQPEAGRVMLHGRDVAGVAPQDRKLSLIFQNFALFPHMTAYQNIAFGLEARGQDKQAVKRGVEEALLFVGLTGLGNRYPTQLSGGQQQRVALARSLVLKPKVLLFDEPLGNLDYQLQRKLAEDIRDMHRELNLTFLYVTHNQEQTMTIADRVMVMMRGQVVQISTPHELYKRPRASLVARLVGETNLLKVKEVTKSGNLVEVKTELGSFSASDAGISDGKNLVYMVRPESVYFGDAAKTCPNRAVSEFLGTIYRGSYTEYLFRLPGGSTFKSMVSSEKTSNISLRGGERVDIGWSTDDALLVEES